jgi:hypothetical protein
MNDHEHDVGGGAIRVHLLAPTAPLLAVLSATSACTAHGLFAAVCCIARTATTTTTAHLLHRCRVQFRFKKNQQSGIST